MMESALNMAAWLGFDYRPVQPFLFLVACHDQSTTLLLLLVHTSPFSTAFTEDWVQREGLSKKYLVIFRVRYSYDKRDSLIL